LENRFNCAGVGMMFSKRLPALFAFICVFLESTFGFERFWPGTNCALMPLIRDLGTSLYILACIGTYWRRRHNPVVPKQCLSGAWHRDGPVPSLLWFFPLYYLSRLTTTLGAGLTARVFNESLR